MKKILLILLLAPILAVGQVSPDVDLSLLTFPQLNKMLDNEVNALKTAEDHGDKAATGRSLSNSGGIYLAIAKKLADGPVQNDQTVSAKTANLNKSIDYSNRSIGPSEEAGDIDQLRTTYKNLNAAQKMAGNLRGAMASYKKMLALKNTIFKSNKANEIDRNKIEYMHEKREDSIRREEQLAEERLKEQARLLAVQQKQQQHILDSTKQTLSRTESEKNQVDLALKSTQNSLMASKMTLEQKDKMLSLAEQEKQLGAASLELKQNQLQLQQRENELQKSILENKDHELAMKDEVLSQQRTITFIAFGGLFVLAVFSFFIVRERRKAIRQKLRAENSERFKQQFLANMSHEIRTPMNAISGMTGLLIDKGPRPDQEHYLKAISKSADILLHVINDVLDLSKIEAGKLELESIDFSLSDAVQQVRDTLAYRAEDKGLQLVTTISADLEDVVVGDPFRLNQILVNIGGNALKFTEKGGVHIDLTAVKREGDRVSVKFAVADTGIGIPADKLPKLFSSFSQVNSSDSRKYGGTGLGLSISKQLVELQGGTISAESRLGVGTTFWFIIDYPVGSAERLRKRVENEQKADGEILDGLSILIADDNEYNRLVINETLHLKSKVTTELVTNGKEAVEALEKNDYDIILMDVQMPVMSGLDATRQIRASLPAPKRSIPIIALTASIMRSDIELCTDSGMNAYVPKPFKPWQLITTIAELTGRRNANGAGDAAPPKKQPAPPKKESRPAVAAKPDVKENNAGPRTASAAAEPVAQPAASNGNGGLTDLGYLHKFCEGDEKRMKKYVKVYLQAVPPFVEKLKNGVASEDFVEVALHVHSFKPKWMMMGMKKTNELGVMIDHLCKERNEKAFEHVATIIDEVNKSVAELEDKC